jgi:hypothetical protein
MPEAVSIHDYHGDFEDVAEFARRVWTLAYRGKMWFPLWDADFFRWQLGEQSGALSAVAYDKGKLVGCSFAIPHSLRMGSSVLPIGLGSWTSVDPGYRRVRLALRLIEALHRRHEETGLAFCIGVVAGDTTSEAVRFWTQYAKAFPDKLCFLFRFGFWAKILAPHILAQAGVEVWERLAGRTLGPILRLTPVRHDPDVRLYRAGDLQRCAEILEKASAGYEWALLWSPKQLAKQLESRISRSLVLEREGRVQGMVNYHCFSLQGRQPVRTALIDLWADDLTGGQRVRLLGHLCNDLRTRDVHLVLALRSAMMPAAAFAANAFLPLPAQTHMIALYPTSGLSLSPPETWSLVMR